MTPFESFTVTDQFVRYLKRAISSGELSGYMPGIRNLASKHGVSSNTVAAAVEQLERDGFLKCQGHGRRSLIVLPEGAPRPAFRVTLLPYESCDIGPDGVAEIRQLLDEKGYDVKIASKSLVELGMKLDRLARMVSRNEADAWVLFGAPREVLEWFVESGIPAFAFLGRFRRLPMAAAGIDKIPAFRAAIRRLIELGHQRIVLIQPKYNREPEVALLIRQSFEEMEAHGIKTGPYNLPAWEPSPEGLRKCLDSLLAVSPPTAIIFDQPNELICGQLYLAQQGVEVPRDISLICDDDDDVFRWTEPSVSCIRWQVRTSIRRTVRWVDNLAHGKEGIRQNFTKAEFIEKGSIGPVPGGKA